MEESVAQDRLPGPRTFVTHGEVLARFATSPVLTGSTFRSDVDSAISQDMVDRGWADMPSQPE